MFNELYLESICLFLFRSILNITTYLSLTPFAPSPFSYYTVAAHALEAQYETIDTVIDIIQV